MKQIYINGKVFTGDKNLKSAFIVEGDRFSYVGCDKEALEKKEDGDIVIDLEKKFVTPGFIDSHMHIINYGHALEICDLINATGSVDEIVNALITFKDEKNIPEGEWITGRGFNQDCFSGAKELPTRHDLDRVSTVHPISITRSCGHCLSVNTKALEMLGIDGSLPQPYGGQFDLDENGYPTGVFRDAAMDMIQTHFKTHTKADFKRMIERVVKKLNSLGITGAHSDDFCVFDKMDYEDVISAYRELEAEGKLTVRINEQSQFVRPEDLKSFLSKGYKTGVGSDLFKIGPLKLLGDGSVGARTAYLTKEYADLPGEKGLAIFTQEQLDELIEIAHLAGMQIAVHCIGDGVLDMVLSSYERAFALAPERDHRSGIVHVQLTRNDQLKKMQQMHLHAYAQTAFLDYDAYIVESRVGKELASTSYAFHTLKTLGCHVSNGTDCPVEIPNPMRGIQCAVTRMPLKEDIPPYNPHECMSVEEALNSYTAEGAYASFDENNKGAIKEGLLADFAIMDGNPFETEHKSLHKIKALKTYLGGKIVYEA
ncbi:MAG: amidohydrolase [Clostridia bacterium]|nr:amidohydrolase [Clostridia bacterium]